VTLGSRHLAVGLLLLLGACEVRALAPVFTDVRTGDSVAPLDLGDAKAVVLIFITADCPIANQYAPQICDLVAAYKDKPVRFYLVHVDPDLTAAAARKHAEEYHHTCAVIRDPEHFLVDRTGVTITPEAALIDSTGIVYRGRINNWYGDVGRKRPLGPTRHDLRDAIAAVLSGQEIKVKRTEAVGCSIAR
jgi:Redoxin